MRFGLGLIHRRMGSNEKPLDIQIADVAAQYLTLVEEGDHFVACCPVHGDTHPSLVVWPNRPGGQGGVWMCYPCGQGGDVADLLVFLGETPGRVQALENIRGREEDLRGLVEASLTPQAAMRLAQVPSRHRRSWAQVVEGLKGGYWWRNWRGEGGE